MIRKMRPYKKRSFHSQLQSSENNMEAENSEDSEKQVSSSPPIEDTDRDKDKDGETKRRKKWKRKISRKQFRHHDIKLFTPGEYKSKSLLKQKDSSPIVPKKPDVASKESITEAIVTSLGGQKQNKGQTEATADSTTKNDIEENNNTNTIQNNNIGKHNLPAIIMETPSIRRRSLDNTNISKPNIISIEHKFDRRTSVDMPLLYPSEQILEAQPQMADSRREHKSNHQPEPNRNQIEQNCLMHPEKNNGHVEANAQRLPEQLQLMPMETSTLPEQPVEPENLSLKRRHAEETPVDLSRKSSHQSNHYHQRLQQNDDLFHMNVETKTNTENFHRSTHRHQATIGRNNAPNHTSTSPNVPHSITPYSDEREFQDQTQCHIVQDTVMKIRNLDMWQEVLNRLLQQPFSIQLLDLLAQAYAQIDRTRNDSSIPPEVRIKAQRLLSEAFSFISGKLKQINLDVDPVFLIKILGQAENTVEKTTLKNYMDNIERINKLAIIEEAGSAIAKMTMSQLPPHYRDRPATSPYSPHINQVQYRRNSRDNSQLSGEPSSRTSHDSSLVGPSPPLGHQGGQSSRTGGHNMPPRYLRGSSPKTDNRPVSGGYSREPSPRIGDHPMPMEILSRTGDYSIPQRWPSPRTNEYHVPSRLSKRMGEYPFSLEHPRGPSPKASHHNMPMDLPPRTEDYSIRQRLSREPSPKGSDHPTLSGRIQKIGEYQFSQGHPKGPSPAAGVHPTAYGHLTGPTARAVEYQVPPQRNSRETSPRSDDHLLLLGRPGAFSRPGGELMQQSIPQRPPSSSALPLDHTSEPSLRVGNQFIAPMFSAARVSDHSVPLGYPRDLQFPHPSPYNLKFAPTNVNLNPFLAQAGHKEPTRSSNLIGRPRSKSHRTVDNKKGLQELRRSLSNPQHMTMEHPLLTHPYLEGASNMMPPPRVPTGTHNFHSMQMNNNLPHQLPKSVQNKELPTAALKPIAPRLYSDEFYQKLHNHLVKENTSSIGVRPQLGTLHKKVPNLKPHINSCDIKETQTVKEEHQKVVFSPQVSKEHRAHKEPPIPLIRSPTEQKISSSTDHIEISKVTNVSKQSAYEKVPMFNSVSPKPPETLKSIPVAVIVADNSMQITKETKYKPDAVLRKDTPKVTDDTRISVSSNSNDNISSSEENLRQAFDREQEENNTEFLVWLEKLKRDEKLKSKFLSQMGIIKKEEPTFTPGGDPIEIVDSDEEGASSPKLETREAKIPAEKSINVTDPPPPQSKESISVPSTQAAITPTPLEVNSGVSTGPNVSEVTRNSTAKQSLSKKGYMPPIPLPYVPNNTGQSLNYSPPTIEKSKKGIYSPQIEPISPVNNEASFVFPDVAKLPRPLSVNSSDRSTAFPDSPTSPTYHKRKNPLDCPDYQKGESGSTKTDYAKDNSVKRRKSLERPELTRSPRVAPIGKLCYVRENHMFFRYFDDTQAELFIRNLSTQDDELLRSTGIEPEQFKNAHKPSNFSLNQQGKKTEVIYFPEYVEFSEKEDIPDVEEFIKETGLVEQFVPKDFADFYRYVTGFQIIKNKHPVSLQTFLTMYNTNRTSELLRKYLERDEVVSRTR